MSLRSDLPEIEEILFRLLDNLSATVSSQTGLTGASVRRQIGRVRADYDGLIINGGFGIALLTCFRLAQDAGAKLESMVQVRCQLFKEEPVGSIAVALVQSAIIFCLSTESRMITAVTFVSRDDVEVMMRKMKLAFDTARELAADAIDSASYQTLTYLAGSLTNHLATSSRHLPRMVKFNLPKNLPSLALSMRLYYTPEKAEELVAEDHIIHPAFCLRELRGLNR